MLTSMAGGDESGFLTLSTRLFARVIGTKKQVGG